MKTTLTTTADKAIAAGIIPHPFDRKQFLARARHHFRKNMAEPGDCKGDTALLMGLAIATAHVGVGPGWIPEVQRIGCEIADLSKIHS